MGNKLGVVKHIESFESRLESVCRTIDRYLIVDLASIVRVRERCLEHEPLGRIVICLVKVLGLLDKLIEPCVICGRNDDDTEVVLTVSFASRNIIGIAYVYVIQAYGEVFAYNRILTYSENNGNRYFREKYVSVKISNKEYLSCLFVILEISILRYGYIVNRFNHFGIGKGKLTFKSVNYVFINEFYYNLLAGLYLDCLIRGSRCKCRYSRCEDHSKSEYER